jgi:hypothetical protein
MEIEVTIKQDAIEPLLIETKLHINRQLFEKGVLTEEMYIKAKEMILNG